MGKTGFLLAVTALFSFSVAAQTTQPSANVLATSIQNEKYRIGFQDVLNIQVYKHQNLNQTVSVSPNGTISLFRLTRPIVAVCKTESELAEEIRTAYMEKDLRNPEIIVSVAEQRSQVVSVIGAGVEKPNTFNLSRRVQLLQVLALAGGPKKEAGTRLTISRTGSEATCKGPNDEADDDVKLVNFKLMDVLQGKVDFWMKPGDVVHIGDADPIYVYGNVNRQGALKVGEQITLTQAIVMAEGLKSAAKKDKIRVIRLKDGTTEPEEFIYDLNQINSRKVRDPYLEPNDIVAVSEDRAKSIILGLANAIKGGAPNIIYRLPMP